MNYLTHIDSELMLLLNFDGGSMMDGLWWFISGKFTWIPLYLFLIWLLYKGSQTGEATSAFRRNNATDWRQFILLLVITVLVVVISDRISSGLIKPWAMRPRPAQPDSGISEWIHTVRGYRGGHYGFVSSHAANTWGIVLWFLLLLRRWRTEHPTDRVTRRFIRHLGVLLILFSLLNCYSRIYLGVHYPGDILGGLAVGTIAALLAFYVLLPLAKRRINGKKAEE